MNTKSRGFTLLEVVIAVALLAFISVFVAQSIRGGLNQRNKIQRDIDAGVSVREALNLMSRDIQLAFNFRDINVELYNAAMKENCKPADQRQNPPGQPPPPPPPPGSVPAPPSPPIFSEEDCAPKQEKILTQFIGEADKINLSTRSNVRTQRNDPTSDQAEVGYELRECRSRARSGSNSQSSRCLWRRFSPVIDDNPREGGTSSVVLENVLSLSFRYLGPGYETEWIKSWSSDGQSATADERMRGTFPLAVEITLVGEDRSVNPPKEVGMTIVAPIRFPNNKEKKDDNGVADQAGENGD